MQVELIPNARSQRFLTEVDTHKLPVTMRVHGIVHNGNYSGLLL